MKLLLVRTLNKRKSMTIRLKVKEANMFMYTYFPIQGRDRVPSVTGPNYSKHSKYNEEKFTKKEVLCLYVNQIHILIHLSQQE